MDEMERWGFLSRDSSPRVNIRDMTPDQIEDAIAEYVRTGLKNVSDQAISNRQPLTDKEVQILTRELNSAARQAYKMAAKSKRGNLPKGNWSRYDTVCLGCYQYMRPGVHHCTREWN